MRLGTRRCPDPTVAGIGSATSSHSAARGRFENGNRYCMWSDRRSKDVEYHHAVLTKRPERKINKLKINVYNLSVLYFCLEFISLKLRIWWLLDSFHCT